MTCWNVERGEHAREAYRTRLFRTFGSEMKVPIDISTQFLIQLSALQRLSRKNALM
jgi:hypothetical protein